MKNNPCKKDCPNRSGTCHAECKEYLEWQEERKAFVKEVNKKRALESGFMEHIVRISDRANRRNK